MFYSQTTSNNNKLAPEITFEKEPPPIEWHLAACNDMDMFNILTVSWLMLIACIVCMYCQIFVSSCVETSDHLGKSSAIFGSLRQTSADFVSSSEDFVFFGRFLSSR